MTREHQQPGRDEVFASPGTASEPATGDDSGAFCSDVVAALSGFAGGGRSTVAVRTVGGEEGVAVKRRGEDLIFGGHASVSNIRSTRVTLKQSHAGTVVRYGIPS
jgi:hypothetical protein